MPRGRDAASGARSRHVGAHRIRGNGVREKRQSGRDGVAHCVHVGADHRRGLRVGVGGAHVPCRTSRSVLPASTGHRLDRCPRPVRGHRRHDAHRRAGRVQPRAATGRLLPRRGDHDGGVPDLSPHLRHGQSRPTDQSRHRLRHRDPVTTTPLPSLVIQARWWVVRGRLVHHAGRGDTARSHARGRSAVGRGAGTAAVGRCPVAGRRASPAAGSLAVPAVPRQPHGRLVGLPRADAGRCFAPPGLHPRGARRRCCPVRARRAASLRRARGPA